MDLLKLAATNNADWCGAIARSHEHSHHRTASAWYCTGEMPPFYPNLVTLDDTPVIPEEIEFLAATLRPGWGIKDSFSRLELRRYGFSLLLAAEWYAREPAEWMAQPRAHESVRVVETQSQLSEWIAAWGETPPGAEIFRPELLDDESVELLSVERNGMVVAGMASNIGEAVGISNVFGEPDCIAACIGRCVKAYPCKAIVGYGSSAELRSLRPLGFGALGPLRIWLKD